MSQSSGSRGAVAGAAPPRAGAYASVPRGENAAADARCAASPGWRGFWGEGVLLVLCSVATIAAASVISAPQSWWPLAFVCLAPWAYATCVVWRGWLAHWVGFLAGFAFFSINVAWMYPVTDLGFVALAFYLAVYWPLAGWAMRSGRRMCVPVTVSLALAWVACEYLRAIVITGFPWLFLAHAFYRQAVLTQISDITGAYGVSFLAAMASGLLVDFAIAWRVRWSSGQVAWATVSDKERSRARRSAIIGVAATVVAAGAVLGYGAARLNDTAFVRGPRIAVIQEDFPLSSEPPYSEDGWVILARYLALAARAAQDQPDIIVLPETTWGATQNREFLAEEMRAVSDIRADTWLYGKRCHEAVAGLARGDYAAVNRVLDQFERWQPAKPLPRLPEQGGPPVTVVLGSLSVEVFPKSVYPNVKKFNSALVYDPDGTQRVERYDKTHLVPFGEVVPFRYGRLHWLYVWLNRLSPFSGKDGKYEYSLTPGEEYTVFNMPAASHDSAGQPQNEAAVGGRAAAAAESGTEAGGGAGPSRFGTPICYEDVMPYVIRRYVWDGGQRRVDFLLNISNDGWFLHSAELTQHLAICTFRAVENRVGIARSVNTGVSGFIDPNGRIYSLVEQDGRVIGDGHGVTGYRVDHVLIDNRGSLYGRLGDWFAQGCLLAALALWGDSIVGRIKARWRRWYAGRAAAPPAVEGG